MTSSDDVKGTSSHAIIPSRRATIMSLTFKLRKSELRIVNATLRYCFSHVWSVFSCLGFQLGAQQPKSFTDKLSIYFSDTWNLVDSFSLLAFVVAAVLRFFDSTYEAARIILSLNIIVFIVRSLQIVSVNRQLGPKLVMIRKMVRLRDFSDVWPQSYNPFGMR